MHYCQGSGYQGTFVQSQSSPQTAMDPPYCLSSLQHALYLPVATLRNAHVQALIRLVPSHLLSSTSCPVWVSRLHYTSSPLHTHIEFGVAYRVGNQTTIDGVTGLVLPSVACQNLLCRLHRTETMVETQTFYWGRVQPFPPSN